MKVLRWSADDQTWWCVVEILHSCCDHHVYGQDVLLTTQSHSSLHWVAGLHTPPNSPTFTSSLSLLYNPLVHWYTKYLHEEREKTNKMLSYRRETALQGALQFSPKVEDWNWKTILYGHYKSIFNHCDIIGLKIYRIPWKNAK